MSRVFKKKFYTSQTCRSSNVVYRIQYCLFLFKFIIIIVITEFLNFYHIHVRFEFYSS